MRTGESTAISCWWAGRHWGMQEGSSSMALGVIPYHMLGLVLHAGDHHLPMSTETAGVALGLGLIVVALITYDYYRHGWSGG